MGVIDWIILLALLVFTYFGLRRGLVGAVVQFIGIVLAFILIGHYYPLLANQLMSKYSLGRTVAVIISVVMILVLMVVLIRFVIWILDRFIKALNLKWLNRLLGAVLGLLNGLILVIVFTFVIDYMPNVSKKLKDPEKHRVYVGMDAMKDDLVEHLKLNNYTKYLKPDFIKTKKKED